MIALLAAVVAWNTRLKYRFARCPECGQRGLESHREVLTAATRTAKGEGRRTTTCTHCGHFTTSTYAIARLGSSSSGSSSGSFGGGSSSGGGASGRW